MKPTIAPLGNLRQMIVFSKANEHAKQIKKKMYIIMRFNPIQETI